MNEEKKILDKMENICSMEHKKLCEAEKGYRDSKASLHKELSIKKDVDIRTN